MSDQGYGGYGEPQYPADPYHGQYGAAPAGAGAPSGSGSNQRGIFIGLGIVLVAGLVVLVLAIAGVFSSDSTPTAGPKQVVEQVLFASKKQNLDDVKAVVCRKDLDDPSLSEIVGDDHATSYSIGNVTEEGDDRAVVAVRVTTKDTSDDPARLVVVKESNEWKVCFSDSASTADFGTTSPSPVPSPTTDSPTTDTPDTDLPTSGLPTSPSFSLCGTQTSAADTAKTFISFITIGSTSLADDCVFPGKITAAQLQALTGDVYDPVQNDGKPGPQFVYRSAQGTSTITLTVEKQADGKFYVTAASKS